MIPISFCYRIFFFFFSFFSNHYKVCTTMPSVFFCQEGRKDIYIYICTILVVKIFGSSLGGTCRPLPPLEEINSAYLKFRRPIVLTG